MKYEESKDRIIAEEILAGIVGALVTFLLFYFISSMIRNTQNSILAGLASITSVLALIFVSSLMVYIVGRFRYENGSYWFALLGSIVGFGVCLLSYYFITVFKVFG